MSVNRWILSHFALVRAIHFLLCSLPAVRLFWRWDHESLGINPVEELLAITGYWSLVFLIATLSVTLLRRLARSTALHYHLRFGRRLPDWNWLIRLRRQLGLFCFFYALLHLLTYLQFEIGFSASYLWDDVTSRLFITSGLTAFVVLFPLTITSNLLSVKALGKYWQVLHRSVYVVALLVIHHVWALAKVGEATLLPYCAALLALLAYRFWSTLPADAVLGILSKPRRQRTVRASDRTAPERGSNPADDSAATGNTPHLAMTRTPLDKR